MNHHIHFDLVSLLSGGAIWSLAAYAAQTFPVPNNKYGAWLLGVIQAGLANKTQAKQNFASANLQNKLDNGGAQ